MDPFFNVYKSVVPEKNEENLSKSAVSYDKLYNNLFNIINNRKQTIPSKFYYSTPEEEKSEIKEEINSKKEEETPEWALPKYQKRYNLFKSGLDRSLENRQSYDTDKWRKFFTDLAFAESSLNADSLNSIGAKGYFQIMPSFRKSEWQNLDELFDDMFALLNSNVDYFKRNMTNEDYEKMSDLGIDLYGLLAGAHLGGAKHALDTLRGISNKKDMNGTSIMSYFKKFSLR